jgi:guanine nucleotide exchange factor VAV
MARTSKADEDFKLCTDWLKRTGVMAPESDIFRPNAQLYDLVFALRDGVTLCCLLNTLKPGCMDTRKFSLHPQSSLVRWL